MVDRIATLEAEISQLIEQITLLAVGLGKEKDEVSRLTQERDGLRESLGFLYDKWENGDSCYEDPEDLDGYIGKAFNLSYDEENKILGLLEATPRTQSTLVAEPQEER